MNHFSKMLSKGFSFILVFILALVLVVGCTEKSKIAFNTEYQAVLLDNGQAFFGKLENVDSPFPVLKDVFYIQRMVNKDTNQVTNTLVKRGNEWHEPDSMNINARHIILIEPVKPGSRVDVLIKDTKTKEPSAGKQQLN
jgi:hypothetical protein